MKYKIPTIIGSIFMICALYIISTSFINVLMYNNNTGTKQEIVTTTNGILELITYGDCYACHRGEPRCELINGRVWCYEEIE